MSWGRTRGTAGPGRPPPGQSRESGRRAVGHPPRPSASAAGAEPAEVALGRGGGGSPGNSGVCPSQCRSTLRGCDGRGRVGVHQHRPTCRGDEGQRGPLRRGRRAPLDVTGVGTVLKPDGRRSEQASDRGRRANLPARRITPTTALHRGGRRAPQCPAFSTCGAGSAGLTGKGQRRCCMGPPTTGDDGWSGLLLRSLR